MISETSGDLYDLAFFYDEVLSHHIWHLGVVGMAILLIVRHWRHPLVEGEMSIGSWVILILTGIIHGFTLFAIFIAGWSLYWREWPVLQLCEKGFG